MMPCGVFGDDLGVHPRPLAELPLEGRQRRQLEEVAQAGGVLGDHRHVGVRAATRDVVALLAGIAPQDALGVEPGAGGDVGLDTDDRRDAHFGCGVVELAGSEHVAVVGHADRGHLQPLRLGQHRLDLGGTVQHRVLGVVVEVHEARTAMKTRRVLSACARSDGSPIGTPVYGRAPTPFGVSRFVSRSFRAPTTRPASLARSPCGVAWLSRTCRGCHRRPSTCAISRPHLRGDLISSGKPDCIAITCQPPASRKRRFEDTRRRPAPTSARSRADSSRPPPPCVPRRRADAPAPPPRAGSGRAAAPRRPAHASPPAGPSSSPSSAARATAAPSDGDTRIRARCRVRSVRSVSTSSGPLA